MLNLILFGPPGSGKGTQATKLLKRYDLIHISTGNLFRYEIDNRTPLGQKAKSYIDKGDLVPDEITVDMLKNKVKKHPGVAGFIFDGFPRTVAQAKALDHFLQTEDRSVSLLIALEVNAQELVNRLLKRGRSSGRADDQDADIIRNRIAVYKNETAPVANHYANNQKTRVIDGTGEIEAIFNRICKEVDLVLA